MSEELRAVVQAQAEARVRGDSAAFASYMAPAATLALRDPQLASIGRTSFRIDDARCDGDVGESRVRFAGPGAWTLRQTWELRDGRWLCEHADASDVTLPLLRRIGRVLGRTNAVPERSDLS